jgi:hypothetical protein
MSLDDEAERGQQFGRLLRGRRIVARRRVRRHADDLSQELDLFRVMRVDPAPQVIAGTHRGGR